MSSKGDVFGVPPLTASGKILFFLFFAKIFSMASSCRMRSFPPREAMTTAELPEPLVLQHSDSIINKQNLQEIVGPAARHSV